MGRRLQPDFDYKSLLASRPSLRRRCRPPRDSTPRPPQERRRADLCVGMYEDARINRSALKDRGNIRRRLIARIFPSPLGGCSRQGEGRREWASVDFRPRARRGVNLACARLVLRGCAG